MKKCAKILLFIVCFISAERFCHYKTEGFVMHKITSDLVPNPAWEVVPLSLEEQEVALKHLDQPFSFLGSGGQCYAFISQDKKTVIKFFKQHHMRPLPWLQKLPLPGFLDKQRHKFLKMREEKLLHIFGSAKISYEKLRKETALLYLHLNRSSHLHKQLTIIDKLGIAHQIELDETSFALQKTAELAYPKLKTLKQEGRTEEAKECLVSLLRLIIARCKQGVADKDPVIKRNFGYIDTEAMEIDIGSFVLSSFLKKPYAYKKELFYETLKLKKWVSKNYPELESYLSQTIEAFLEKDEPL